jgi:hypothetical protein
LHINERTPKLDNLLVMSRGDDLKLLRLVRFPMVATRDIIPPLKLIGGDAVWAISAG